MVVKYDKMIIIFLELFMSEDILQDIYKYFRINRN